MKQEPSGVFSAYFYDQDRSKASICLGRAFATAEEAARAVNVETRRRGLLHLLNVPLNDAERAAVRALPSRGGRPNTGKRPRAASAAADVELRHTAGAVEAVADAAGVAPAATTPSASAAAGAADPSLLQVARKRLLGSGGGPVQSVAQQPVQARMPHGGGGGSSGVTPALAAAGGGAQLASAAAAAAAPPGSDDTADLEGFLLSIFPPLRCLTAALDAAAQCQVQHADLVTAAVAAPAYREDLVAFACEELGIEDDGDRAAFTRAVQALGGGAG